MPGRTANERPDPFRLQADTDLGALQRVDRARYPFLLQSSAPGGPLGRHDILFAAPRESIVLDRVLPGRATGGGFLDRLDAAFEDGGPRLAPPGLPFGGGWFLYLGYELAAEIEASLGVAGESRLPVAFAVRCPAAIIRRHADDTVWLVREQEDSIDPSVVEADILQSARVTTNRVSVSRVEEEPAARFLDAVVAAKGHIGAGDIYQANLSRGWRAKLDDGADAHDVLASLNRSNPAPFAGLAFWGDTAIISSSPERLLGIRDGVAATRPIAGTRPRSGDRDIDDGLSAELIAHPKERAEHVMLIDLERNDLGRVCVPGSVEVDEMMVVETYAHVHHIVSNVRGRLRDGTTPGAAIRAVFPGGTITGCPKVRCMQIIADLEAGPRGAYTGSFGYLDRSGAMDLNILIRTMVLDGHRIEFRAGSGIVADSDPDMELAETRAKARGLLKALSR